LSWSIAMFRLTIAIAIALASCSSKLSLADCDAATNLRKKLELQSRQTAKLAEDSANATRQVRNEPCGYLIGALEQWNSCINNLAKKEVALAPIEDLQALTGSGKYVEDLIISDKKSLELLNESKRLMSEAGKLSQQIQGGQCPA
jgi:hypothetical protein